MVAASGDVRVSEPHFTRLEIFSKGDDFFTTLERAFDAAENTIDIEMYIFSLDALGERIFQALVRAVERGVRVRLLVDGVGSAPWVRAIQERSRRVGIQCKVFHALPGAAAVFSTTDVDRPRRWKQWLRRLNRRNHRKVCLVDSRMAFLGSMNIADYHLAWVVQDAAWRDTGVVIEGEAVRGIQESFDEVWGGALRRWRKRFDLRRTRRERRRIRPPGIRLNTYRRERRENYLDLLFRIVSARDKIWVTNAYFVPDGSLLRALSAAAQGGVDVRILVPGFSDIIFMPWIASAFHLGLLKAGVRIFEYRKSILHAKTMVVDSWALIGSSNLNHRSLLHDLEIDVEITDQAPRTILEEQFLEDLTHSEEITLSTWNSRPWVVRAIGRVLLAFRHLL